MKKLILSCILAFVFCTLYSQEEVTFNFTRKKAIFSSASKISVFVNESEVTRLKNGGSFTHKELLDLSKPVTVLVKSGLSKREIVFTIGESKECNIETGFPGGILYLTLISGGRIVPGTGMKTTARVNQKDLSISYTIDKTLASDTIRLQWIEKGGSIMSMSYIGGLTFLSLNNSDMSMTGFGGQFAVTTTFLKLKIPEYKPGIRSWNSGVLGYTVMD